MPLLQPLPRGGNSVTAWSLVPVLQVTIVPVPIRSSPDQPSDYHLKKDQIWDQVICLWLEIILDVISNQSAITSRFTDRLSWTVGQPQLVTIVPVLQRQRSQLCPATVTVVPVLQTHKITALWGLHLYISYLTDTGMSVKHIKLHRDPTIWTMDTLIPVRHIYIDARRASMCQEKYYGIRPQVCFTL